MDDTTIVGDRVAVVASSVQAGWSGISWSAVIAGALTAIAVTIIIISLGSGIGMALASPYSASPSTETMTVIGALWLVFSQAVGFATGGYVAGRLRRSPVPLHAAEVKFRDGANGLVVWAIGVVVSVIILAAAVGKVGSAVSSAAEGAAGAGAVAAQSPPVNYYSDMLLRPSPRNAAAAAAANGAAGAAAPPAGAETGAAQSGTATNSTAGIAAARQQQAEVNRILVTSLGLNGLSKDDGAYLAQVVSARTGLSQDEAQHRVDAVVGQMKLEAKTAADTARKAAAYLSFWTFMSLLFGAVCATLGGMLGGDLRDEFANRQAVPQPVPMAPR